MGGNRGGEVEVVGEKGGKECRSGRAWLGGVDCVSEIPWCFFFFCFFLTRKLLLDISLARLS